MGKREATQTQQATQLLKAWSGGDRVAADRLFPLVYDELRRLAHAKLRRERPGHTLSTTALVHEAYLRLIDQTRVEWQSRAHFFAIAAQAMRRILVDYARRRCAQKRGGPQRPLALEEGQVAVDEQAALVVTLDAALRRLGARSERMACVVECRFFGGLTQRETAEALGVSARTVRRDWQKARAWLYKELKPETA